MVLNLRLVLIAAVLSSLRGHLPRYAFYSQRKARAEAIQGLLLFIQTDARLSGLSPKQPPSHIFQPATLNPEQTLPPPPAPESKMSAAALERNRKLTSRDNTAAHSTCFFSCSSSSSTGNSHLPATSLMPRNLMRRHELAVRWQKMDLTHAYRLSCRMAGRGGLPGRNDGLSWTWVGNCANPTRIAVNRGFGGVTEKSANVQLCVVESQVQIRGAGRRSILICSQQAPGLWLGSLSERPSECHQHLRAAVLKMRSRQVMSCAANLLAELPFLLGADSAAETKTSIRERSSFKRKKTSAICAFYTTAQFHWLT